MFKIKNKRNFHIIISVKSISISSNYKTILIQEGSILNTLKPKQYTPFWYLVKFTEG